MRNSDEIDMVRGMIVAREYEGAIQRCSALLRAEDIDVLEVLRLRASAYYRIGDYDRATADYATRLTLQGDDFVADLWLAAYFGALPARRFQKAIAWLEEAITLSRARHDNRFLSASYFIKAYAFIELDDVEGAAAALTEAVRLDPSINMYVPDVGMCTAAELQQAIEERKQISGAS